MQDSATPSRRDWTSDQVRNRAAQLGPWFHNMQLKGVWTAPDHFLGDYPNVKWRSYADAIPLDLRGKSVLDIGCNGGFFSMQMKRRGADRVLGVDFDDDYLAQARFAAEVEGLDIEFRRLSVYDIGALNERFDIVFFIGVFYHLRHPLLALDLIHEHVANDLLVFQSLQRGSTQVARLADDYPFTETRPFDEPGYPKMHFIENSYAADHTNWWAPNRACTEAMLRSAGFEITSRPEEETYLCRRMARPYPSYGAVYPAPGRARRDSAEVLLGTPPVPEPRASAGDPPGSRDPDPASAFPAVERAPEHSSAKGVVPGTSHEPALRERHPPAGRAAKREDCA